MLSTFVGSCFDFALLSLFKAATIRCVFGGVLINTFYLFFSLYVMFLSKCVFFPQGIALADQILNKPSDTTASEKTSGTTTINFRAIFYGPSKLSLF